MPGTHRRLLWLVVAPVVVAIAGAACAPAEEPPNIPVKEEGSFLVQVVDQLYDAGRGASVALQKDGKPAVSYLLYKPVLNRGDIPPPIVPGTPQPPAVIVATLSKGIWNRVSVTPQKTSPAEGDAPEIANDQGQALPGVRTGIAVDSQDKHHVVWSTPKGGVFYSDDTAGGFSQPEKIIGSAAYGASITVGSDGTAWVAFYAGGSLRVAQRTGPGKWKVDEVQKNAGPATNPATVTAIGVSGAGQAVVAYGDHGTTVIARGSNGSWKTEDVPGDGGYGVSLALHGGDVDVAFYDVAGNVRLARSVGGGPAQVSDLASTAAGPNGQSDPRWSTGIGVDDAGTVYVTWADTRANQVVVAKGKDTPSPQPLADSSDGANPSMAVSKDGKAQALAWFERVNANLEVAQSPAGGLVLAHPLTPAPTPSGGATTPPAATCEPDGTSLQISAQNIAFDKNCLAAPAGKPITIEFNNKEAVPHNLEIFPNAQDAAAFSNALGGAKGPSDIVSGPATATYKVDPLKPGTYYFQCDIHPQQMNGTFVVK